MWSIHNSQYKVSIATTDSSLFIIDMKLYQVEPLLTCVAGLASFRIPIGIQALTPNNQHLRIMNPIFAAFLGGWEIVLILAVVLLLFGAKKLPELARGLGKGINEFKKASNEVTEEFNRATDMDSVPQRKLPPEGSRPIDSQSNQTKPQ